MKEFDLLVKAVGIVPKEAKCKDCRHRLRFELNDHSTKIVQCCELQPSDTPDKGGTYRYLAYVNDDGSNNAGAWDKYEDCVLYGIEYAIDNLI